MVQKYNKNGFAVNRFADTGNIEVYKDGEGCVARSRNNMLFIFDSTRPDTATKIAERYGCAFGVVFYRNYDAWMPGVEAAADWVC